MLARHSGTNYFIVKPVCQLCFWVGGRFIAAVSIHLRQTQCVIYRPDISSHIHGCLCFALTVHILPLLFVVNSWIWMWGEIIAFHRCGNRWIVKRKLIKQSTLSLPSPFSLLFSQPRQTSYETMNTHSPESQDNVRDPELMWLQKTQKLKVELTFIDSIHLYLCRRRWGCLAQSIALMHNSLRGFPLKMKMSAQWAHCHPGFHFCCDGRNFW